MRVRSFSIVPAIGLALATMMVARTGANALTCPSPAPTCSSSGVLSDFSGAFACTWISTATTGELKVQLVTLNADGAGNISGTRASNSDGTGSTFVDFGPPASGATYCLNSDDTGYIFGLFGCPWTLVIDDTLGEVRLIETTETNAGAITCRAQ